MPDGQGRCLELGTAVPSPGLPLATGHPLHAPEAHPDFGMPQRRTRVAWMVRSPQRRHGVSTKSGPTAVVAMPPGSDRARDPPRHAAVVPGPSLDTGPLLVEPGRSRDDS